MCFDVALPGSRLSAGRRATRRNGGFTFKMYIRGYTSAR